MPSVDHYATSPSGFSTICLNACINCAPSAPSIARWSKLPVADMTVAIETASSTIQGRFPPAPIAMVMPCGGGSEEHTAELPSTMRRSCAGLGLNNNRIQYTLRTQHDERCI